MDPIQSAGHSCCAERPRRVGLRRIGGALSLCVAVLACGATPALAQPARNQDRPAHGLPASVALFKDADLALGEKLMVDHACAECHVRRVGGDGNSIYRPQGRIGTPSALLSMVERCSIELKLNLFAEEVLALAAVLERDHYRFGRAGAERGAVVPKASPRP